MRNAQRAGWATSLTPTLNDFFSTRKKAREAAIDLLTASPTSKCVVKPAILVGGPFFGTIKVCLTPGQIQEWGRVAVRDRQKLAEQQLERQKLVQTQLDY
jgi:hypothetical protein